MWLVNGVVYLTPDGHRVLKNNAWPRPEFEKEPQYEGINHLIEIQKKTIVRVHIGG